MAMYFTITCKDQESRATLGESMNDALVGSPGYINNEIVLNYTEPNSSDILLIVGNDNDEDMFIQVDAENITVI